MLTSFAYGDGVGFETSRYDSILSRKRVRGDGEGFKTSRFARYDRLLHEVG